MGAALGNNVSSVNVQRGPRDHFGGWSREEENGVCSFRRLKESFDWSPIQHPFESLRVGLDVLLRERGDHVGGTDAVDADGGTEFHCHALRQHRHSRLGSTVHADARQNGLGSLNPSQPYIFMLM